MQTADDCVLGIDLGTGSTKCVVMNSRGRCLASASRAYLTSYPALGFAEQDPHDWYSGVVGSVREAIQGAGTTGDRIRCIGICGAAHIPVLLNSRLDVCRPAILWSDQRSGLEVEYLVEHHDHEILDVGYNQASCTWTLPQLMWISRNEPDTFDQVRHLLVSKDYIVFRFTGKLATDIGSAVSTLMVDARREQWSPILSSLSGLFPSALPPIFSPGDIVGGLTRDSAEDLGLPADVKVIAGALDSAMELLGTGVIRPSQGIVRLGTAGAVMMIAEEPRPERGILTYPHVISPYWYCQAGTNSCGTALQWVRDFVAPAPGQTGKSLSYPELDDLAHAAPPGCDGLVFHPYLLGERAPYWDSNLRASFIGASINHGKGHFVRAVQEGVAFSLRDCLESLQRLGFRMEEARLGGGGSKSALWSQIVCDVLEA